ncbi:protein SlyX [Escherichia coli]|uniref:Protein SlyX n=1 Tax=Escherichia coli TaxID=562 RepID=A0A376RDG8_ECOLX|nr:protein SlyX [Escherichia coli]
MQDLSLEARLAELESRLAFQEITIEELNVTVTLMNGDGETARSSASADREVKSQPAVEHRVAGEETPPPHY